MLYNWLIDWILLIRNIYVDCYNYEFFVWFDVCMCINKKKSKMLFYVKFCLYVNFIYGISLFFVYVLYIKFII